MESTDTTPCYLVFDVESVADGNLVSKVRYPGESLDPQAAVDRYRGELMEKFDSDFVPYTYHVPIAVAIAKVNSRYELIDVVTLDRPDYRAPIITENFWRGWEAYKQPTFVTFNGRTFDLPLLELAAFRYGISVPSWFNMEDRSYEQRRNRYNQQAHLDLQDLLTNFGATRFSGGLNLAANLLGTAGKMDTKGHMVQELYEEGKAAEINDYCRCDVLDTYFVFLRTLVVTGKITLAREQELVGQTIRWLETQTDAAEIYAEYLKRSSMWDNPWLEFGVSQPPLPEPAPGATGE